MVLTVRASVDYPTRYIMGVLSDFTPSSVIMLARTTSTGDLVGAFDGLVAEHFPDATRYVLRRHVSTVLKVVTVLAGRKLAPYNVLLRIDLPTELTRRQHEALTELRRRPLAGVERLRVFHARNHQFHHENRTSDDVVMAFINTWPAGITRQAAQRHWLDEHGPLVRGTGLPPVITSYTQIHFDDTLDTDYQGLSFETITSQRKLVNRFLTDAAFRRLNKLLLDDEKRFTGPPLFFAFTDATGRDQT